MTSESPEEFDPTEQRRPRRLSEAEAEEITFPLAWVVIGGLAALIVIGLLGLGIVNIFRQGAITPTPQDAPPLVEEVQPATSGDDAPAAEAPAPQQTEGEQATTPAEEQPAAGEGEAAQPVEPETPAQPAGSITIDGFVRVVGTDGAGVSMRAGPSTDNARLLTAEESDDIILGVIDGPRADEKGEDFIWWFVRHPDGTEGWVVEDFIEATAGQ